MISDAQAAELLATLIDPNESWAVDDAADDHGGYGIKASAGGYVVLIDGYETDANHASNLAVIAAAPDALRTVAARAAEIAKLRHRVDALEGAVLAVLAEHDEIESSTPGFPDYPAERPVLEGLALLFKMPEAPE